MNSNIICNFAKRSLHPLLYKGCQPGSIELMNLSWAPKAKPLLLKNINIKINSGEFLAIVGPNGSGKTSLLRCLYRINKPTRGQVLLDGKDIWSLSNRAASQRIATVLQEASGEFGLTVYEMVEVGLTPRSRSWQRSPKDNILIQQAMMLMNIDQLSNRNFDTLSGGEKQRVMIARALAQRPDVLILDEPTNHLDIRHQLEILDILTKLPCTLIVSLHDLALASAYADRALVMQNGEIQSCSPPTQVFTKQCIKQVFDVDTVIDQHPVTSRPRFSFYINYS